MTICFPSLCFSVGGRYLRLDMEGFYDDHLPAGVKVVEVEAILTRIHHTRKVGVMTLIGKSVGNWDKGLIDFYFDLCNSEKKGKSKTVRLRCIQHITV